ncbi:MAG: GGDEF domain-containing protein [Spirochaetaceae bacterium]|nr:GGDEF domain-containing protein [Spirochaetaceae bacterium]
MTSSKTDQLAMLRNILNGMEAIICVCDSETFDILFLNDSMREKFHVTGDGIGHKCYKLLQDLDEPCASCPYEQLRQEPGKSIVWEHKERIYGTILRKTGRLIDWPDGRKAHLEYSIDITELRKTQATVVELESEIEKMYYDSLTGIYNRRYFDENLGRLLNTLSRSDGVFSLMMADIDHFKKYNDTYGHVQGDECLRIIAETLHNGTTRKDDFVARYGGEEFVIVLPNTDENGARLIAERLIESVRNKNILHEEGGDNRCVTISIGVATGDVKQTFTAEDFIHRADDMLYESKRNGRNKYTFASL